MKATNQPTRFIDFLSTKLISWILVFLLLVVHISFVYTKPQLLLFNRPTEIVILLILICLLCVGYYDIHKKNDIKIASRLEHHTLHQEIHLEVNDFVSILAATLGAAITHFAISYSELPHILVASGTALIVSSVINFIKNDWFKNFEFAFYTGVFVGTTSKEWANNTHWPILIGGCMAGSLFVLSKNTLIGVGGRLGSFAFVAVWVINYFIS